MWFMPAVQAALGVVGSLQKSAQAKKENRARALLGEVPVDEGPGVLGALGGVAGAIGSLSRKDEQQQQPFNPGAPYDPEEENEIEESRKAIQGL